MHVCKLVNRELLVGFEVLLVKHNGFMELRLPYG